MPKYTEDSILKMIDILFKGKHASLLLGRGDDCCIFQAKQKNCVSTDMFLEHIHFRRNYFSAYEIGHKALAVNISDIAACGANPIAFTLNLALPQNLENEWLQEFFQGMSDLAHRYKMVLAGGDLSKAQEIYISITIWGESTNNENFLTRGNSKVDDTIFFVGDIGLARAGLTLLEKNGRPIMKKWPKACVSHLRPMPLVEEALLISKLAQEYNFPLPALMDISDGILRDLPRLLATIKHDKGSIIDNSSSIENYSSTETSSITENDYGTKNISEDKNWVGSCYGAELFLNEKMLDQELIQYCKEYDLNPIDHALRGGEDYALLGACSPSLIPILQKNLPNLKVLGKVEHKPNIRCNNILLPTNSGFDHFS